MKKTSYNFVTVANTSYSLFLELFIKSLLDVVNPRLINHIYIFDTGLEERTKRKLYLSDNISFIATEIDHQDTVLHDTGWQASTYFKTTALLHTLNMNQHPAIMLDCDTIILRDFGYLLDGVYDIGVCRTDQSNITKYLGSFFVARNIPLSKLFINAWINEMNYLNDLPKESPSLVKTVSQFKHFNIREFKESRICSLIPNEYAHIYHLKSGGPLRTIDARLNQAHVKPLLQKYLGQDYARTPWDQ